jgi:hypothetical protein
MSIKITDDLKDMPHIVVLKTPGGGLLLHEYEGPGCMEEAHAFAQKLSMEREDGQVLVAMRYRKITGPDAIQML